MMRRINVGSGQTTPCPYPHQQGYTSTKHNITNFTHTPLPFRRSGSHAVTMATPLEELRKLNLTEKINAAQKDETPERAQSPKDTTIQDTLAQPPTAAFTPVHSKIKKHPPPEKPESIRNRRYVIAAFLSIALFLGIPLWLYTQRVVRSELPLEGMSSWSSGQACKPVFPLRIEVEAPGWGKNGMGEEVQGLVEGVQMELDDMNDFSAHHLRLSLTNLTRCQSAAEMDADWLAGNIRKEEKDNLALTVRLLPGEKQGTKLQPYDTVLDVYYTPNQISASTSSASLALYIATQLRELFAEERAMISHLMSTSSIPSTLPAKELNNLSPAMTEKLRKRAVRSVKYAPTYHLTFSLFTPTASPSSWPIEDVLRRDMAPLLSALSPFSNFTIDSQVQLYATPSISPSAILEPNGTETGQVWRTEELSSFINHAEWPLTPSIGAPPTLHFLLYVSPYPIAAMDGKTSSSFLIPQTGGVVILPSATEENLRNAMRIWSTQLLDLLGAPDDAKLSLPLRIGALVRFRTLQLLLSTSATLSSLLRLTSLLPTIPIPSSVAELTRSAIKDLQATCGQLGSRNGLEIVAKAYEKGEKAFFDKRMVGQVYFPDEHRVAVLLPLLGPVGVPVLMAVLKEVKAWKTGRG